MQNVRLSDEIQKKGFMIIPFPESLKDTMRHYIRSYIEGIAGAEKDLTKSVMKLADEDFSRNLGSKPLRMFPQTIANELYSWAASLAHFLGGIQCGINYVSLVERKQNRNLSEDSYDVFWRCVRPGKGDVGAPHADYQFWELAKGTEEEPGVPFSYDERWKIWIPLMGCVSENSLQVIPESHREDIPTSLRETKNGLRPNIDKEWLDQNDKRFICPFQEWTNTCVLFHDKLVHKGPPNKAQNLRVSAELTLLLKLAPEEALV